MPTTELEMIVKQLRFRGAVHYEPRGGVCELHAVLGPDWCEPCEPCRLGMFVDPSYALLNCETTR